jgi:hypothetical protein
MHPWTLHATTAHWALRRSWAALHDQAAAARLEAPDGLHGTTYGSRHSTGGHSDGIGDLITAPPSWEHWARVDERVREHVTQACWLIRSATGMPRHGRQLLDYVADGIGHHRATPATARDVTGYLADADRVARRAVLLVDERVALPGIDCPACGVRMLEAHTAAPRHAWTITCAAGCRCTGSTCPCATLLPDTTPASDVPHIWPWFSVTRAVPMPTDERAA